MGKKDLLKNVKKVYLGAKVKKQEKRLAKKEKLERLPENFLQEISKAAEESSSVPWHFI